MDRKEFLASVLALGGAALVPANASVLDKMEELSAEAPSKRIDPSLAVLMSDIHICGELKDGKSIHYPYNPTCLELRVKEILAMRPLPANVLVFGDVAWDYGFEEDYRYASELLRPLEEAGVRVTLGLGNHDRRAAFFKVFSQYADTTPVKGRAVSVVKLPDVDFIMLDSLTEKPDLKPRQSTTVSGTISDEQIEWLKDYLAKSDRPVILGAHHPLSELRNLTKMLEDSPTVAAFIYGHVHIWNKSVSIIRPREPQHMLPTVALPATFYGDIGFAVMRTSPKGAKITYSSKGFWWPQPEDNPPAEWLQRQKDLANEECTILF